MSLQLVHFDEIPSFTMVAGVEGRPLFGESAMLNLVTFEPGAVVPAHSHPHEQLGLVIKGTQFLVIEGVEHELREGDGYVLPGDVLHSGHCGPEGATVLDIFCPVRADYLERVNGGG